MTARRLVGMLVAIGIAAVPVAVAAHSELDKSNPPNGANVLTAPTEVVLTFTQELDPSASGFKVTDASGAQVGKGQIDLTVAARNVMRGAVSITKPGTYRIAWTSLSLDGDQLQGTVTFSYRPSWPPNSSMRRRPGADPLPLTAMGLLLLAAPALTVVRRRALR